MLESIESLRANLKKSKIFSEDFLDGIRKLTAAVALEVKIRLCNGEMPVFKSSHGTFLSVSLSTKKPGMYQVTLYSENVIFGDSQYACIVEAIREYGMIYLDLIDASEAEVLFQEVVTHECAEFFENSHAS